MSPVVASMYCSPHLAALQIDTPPGSGSFASMIPRPENYFAMMIDKNSYSLPRQNYSDCSGSNTAR
jgi:hypothetical protein